MLFICFSCYYFITFEYLVCHQILYLKYFVLLEFFCISHEFKLHGVRIWSVLFTIVLVTSAILTDIETCLLSKYLWNEWMMNIAFTLNFVNQYCNLSSFFFLPLLGHCKKNKSVTKLAINSQVYRLKFKFLHFALKNLLSLTIPRFLLS